MGGERELAGRQRHLPATAHKPLLTPLRRHSGPTARDESPRRGDSACLGRRRHAGSRSTIAAFLCDPILRSVPARRAPAPIRPIALSGPIAAKHFTINAATPGGVRPHPYTCARKKNSIITRDLIDWTAEHRDAMARATIEHRRPRLEEV